MGLAPLGGFTFKDTSAGPFSRTGGAGDTTAKSYGALSILGSEPVSLRLFFDVSALGNANDTVRLELYDSGGVLASSVTVTPGATGSNFVGRISEVVVESVSDIKVIIHTTTGATTTISNLRLVAFAP